MGVPVWFDLDADGSVTFTTWHETIKARSIRRDPRVSICIDEETPPFDYVRIDGRAEQIDDFELLGRWATRLAARYMGAPLAEAIGNRNAVQGGVVVRVTPTRVIGLAEIAA